MTQPLKKHRTRNKAAASQKSRTANGSFDMIMLEVTRKMPRYGRLFSRFIHKSAVASASDLLGTIVARPNAILFGAVASFSLTLTVYLLSKNLGYSLSGSEPLVGFCVGWTTGTAYDILAHFFGKRQP